MFWDIKKYLENLHLKHSFWKFSWENFDILLRKWANKKVIQIEIF